MRMQRGRMDAKRQVPRLLLVVQRRGFEAAEHFDDGPFPHLNLALACANARLLQPKRTGKRYKTVEI